MQQKKEFEMKEYTNYNMDKFDDAEEMFVIMDFVHAYTLAVRSQYTGLLATIDLEGPLERLREKSEFPRYARLKQLWHVAFTLVEALPENDLEETCANLRADLREFFL